MLLLHMVATPAAVRAGWAGLAAITTLVAGTRSTPCETHRSSHRAVIMTAHHASSRTGADIQRYVIATRLRVRAQVEARLRAEEALARATTRLRRERIALATTPGALDGARERLSPPTRAEMDALAALSASAAHEGLGMPSVPPVAPVAPAPPPEPAVAHEDAPASRFAERSVRVLAAIAVFLLGMA